MGLIDMKLITVMCSAMTFLAMTFPAMTFLAMGPYLSEMIEKYYSSWSLITMCRKSDDIEFQNSRHRLHDSKFHGSRPHDSKPHGS